MLQTVRSKKQKAAAGRYAIVASRYNAKYVDSMLRAARKTLQAAGAEEIKVVRVPGAYEVPVAAALLAQARPPYAAVICLGVILRGETEHARLIGEAVTTALMELQVRHGIPMAHEVLLLENTAQADKRCLSPEHNRGREAAQTALEMARIAADLRNKA